MVDLAADVITCYFIVGSLNTLKENGVLYDLPLCLQEAGATWYVTWINCHIICIQIVVA